MAGWPGGGDADKDEAAAVDQLRLATNPAIRRPAPISGSQDVPAIVVVGGLLEGQRHQSFVGTLEVGKTTSLSRLLLAIQAGGEFLGKLIPAGQSLLRHRGTRRLILGRSTPTPGITDATYMLVQPFRCKPSLSDWLAWLAWFGDWLAKNPFDLVVFDTLSSVWPIQERELMPAKSRPRQCRFANSSRTDHWPWFTISRSSMPAMGRGCAVAVALMGFVDIVSEMRRFGKTGSRCGQR